MLIIVARVLHILFGVFWVGTVMFSAVFLVPAMQDAGPDGAKFGAALARRRFMDIMPPIAGVNILSGLWLYWKVSGGFQPAFMRSGFGMTLGLGAVAAIAGFAVGVRVMRPAMMQAAALAQSAAQAPVAERDAQLAKAQALRLRAGAAGRVVALLLALAVILMAVARYV